jgi:hypothetical protein
VRTQALEQACIVLMDRATFGEDSPIVRWARIAITGVVQPEVRA